MTILELLAKFPPDKLKVQFVGECLSRIDAGKKCASITIKTDAMTPGQWMTGTEPVGIIIWVPKELWEVATKTEKAPAE